MPSLKLLFYENKAVIVLYVNGRLQYQKRAKITTIRQVRCVAHYAGIATASRVKFII